MKKMVMLSIIVLLMLPMVTYAGGGSQRSSNEIHIGSVICSEGAFAVVGVPYGNFLRAYADYVNQSPDYQDILRGRTLRLTVYDDRGDGALGKTYIERLIHDDRVFANVGIL